jgi:predicted esterase YcpF (UPF0227 family)
MGAMLGAPRILPPTHLLYLHGFRSSPQSFKAQRLAREVQTQQAQGQPLVWGCPQLPPSPQQTMAELRDLVRHWPSESMVVIGSSLGGFYATVLAQERGCRFAVINPAVQPARDLARHIGEQTAFHDPSERFYFRLEFIQQFALLDPYPLKRPERYWALVAEGDEVLDWREMVAHYPGVDMTVLPGGDHAVSDFAEHLPALLRWLDLTQA